MGSRRCRRPAIRAVYFGGAGGFLPCEVVSRYELEPGARTEGPAVIEEKDSTTIVHPGFAAVALEQGELLLAAV